MIYRGFTIATIAKPKTKASVHCLVKAQTGLWLFYEPNQRAARKSIDILLKHTFKILETPNDKLIEN